MRDDRASAVMVACCMITALLPGVTVPADELPHQLARAFENDSTVVISYISWQSVSGLPIVNRLREIGDDGVDVEPARTMFAPFLKTIGELGVDNRHIVGVWSIDSIVGRFPAGLWIETDLEAAELGTALAEAGWVESGDHSQVLIRPTIRELELADIFPHMDSEEREAFIGGMTEEEVEQMLRNAADARTKLKPIGGGWLLAVSGHGAPAEDVLAGLVDTDTLEPGFPFSEILTPSSSVVIAMAIDVPHNDRPIEQPWDRFADSARGAEDESEEQQVRRRLRQLQTMPERTLAGQLADFAILVSESDGGLVLDVRARRAGGGGEEQTARFLEMLVLATRFYLGPMSPQLDRELGEVLIQVWSGEVRARLAVSGATLLDTLEAHAARSREISVLRRRLAELEGP